MWSGTEVLAPMDIGENKLWGGELVDKECYLLECIKSAGELHVWTERAC